MQALQEVTGSSGRAGRSPENIRPQGIPVPSAGPAQIQDSINGTAVEKEEVTPPVNGVTIISKGSSVCGSICTESDLFVHGEVQGDIASIGTVTVSGMVRGNIRGAGIRLLGAQVQGDLKSERMVIIGNGTELSGNVEATIIEVSGQVKGDISGTELVTVHEKASVQGNVQASYLQVSKGGLISGEVRIRAEGRPDKPEGDRPAPQLSEITERITVISEKDEDAS